MHRRSWVAENQVLTPKGNRHDNGQHQRVLMFNGTHHRCDSDGPVSGEPRYVFVLNGLESQNVD